ncbi:MAG: PAS domain S-box protein [archaeon]|nr:PAS domain S-box protein [archaeon]
MDKRMTTKDTRYKVTVSIIFGLIGFAVNFHTINFSFPPYTATVLIGLIFPMLITRAWGWRYGLLSALAGGCQSIWWAWGPSNGYATFFVVIPFTLWILWHGYVSDLRRKRKIQQWWLNPYIAEIPFRILSTINLYTLSRWAITFNPPPWSWASDATNTIPMHFSHFVVVKQLVVGYVILLLADVLLNLGFVRKFFGLEEKTDQSNTNYIISASLLFGIIFWVADCIIGSRIFHPESSFLDLLALNIPAYDLYVRTFFILTCLAGGLIVSKQLHKQHESKKAMQKSEEKYHLLTDNTIDCIWQMDLGLKFIYVNPSVFKMFGFTEEEWIGSSLSEHCSPKTMRYMLNLKNKILKEAIKKDPKSNSITFETEQLNKDGKTVPVEITAKILFNKFFIPTGIQGTTRDITERKKVEEKLKIFGKALNSTTDAAIISDMDCKIEYVNPALLQNAGVKTEKEIIGHRLSEFIAPESWKLLKEEISPSLSKKGGWKGRLELLRKDGSHYPSILTTSIIKDKNGKPWKNVCLFKDITESKKIEKKMETSLHEKEVLLKEIHHRVKNNLQIVSSLLNMQAKATKNKDITQILSESKNRINTMALIHSQLYENKDLSKINMKGFISRLLKQLFQSYNIRNTKISQNIHIGNYQFPIDTAIPVGLIVNELLTNSIKHGFTGRKEGKIDIALTASKKGEYTLIVSDDGIGLPTGFDIDKSKTLGLHLIKILVENQLQGTMKITCKRGKETAFKINFKTGTD